MKNIKNFLVNFLTATGLITLAWYILSNYESINSGWWVTSITTTIIGLLVAIVHIWKKPTFTLTLAGNLIFIFYLSDNLLYNFELPIPDSIMNFLIKFLIILLLSLGTEFIVADISAKNIIFDAILGILAILLYNNISFIIPDEWQWLLPLVQLIILLLFSFLVVMIDNPMKMRSLDTGSKDDE